MQVEETEIDMVVECVDDVPPLRRTRPLVLGLRNARQGQGEGWQRRHQYQQEQHHQHHHKGEGKGGSNESDGPKGGGKGYQDECGRCDQVGHKATECTKHVHFVEEASPREVEVVEVGGLWMVGGVDGDKRSRP